MPGVWISDGSSRSKKFRLYKLSCTSNIFVSYDRSDSPDNISTI